jgi:hypothetical protein
VVVKPEKNAVANSVPVSGALTTARVAEPGAAAASGGSLQLQVVHEPGVPRQVPVVLLLPRYASPSYSRSFH